MRTAIRHTAGLTIATLVLWLLLLFPAWWLAGLEALEGLSYAALLCLIPGWLVIWLSKLMGSSGQQAPMLAMAGSVFRMLFVLLGTIVVQSLRSQLGLREFLVWLIVLYLATLLIETLLILAPATAGASTAGASTAGASTAADTSNQAAGNNEAV